MLEEALLKYMFASLCLTSRPRQRNENLSCADLAQLQSASYNTRQMGSSLSGLAEFLSAFIHTRLLWHDQIAISAGAANS